MPINDILAEQVQRGEIDPEDLAAYGVNTPAVGAQNGADGAAGASPQRAGSTPSLDNIIQLEKTDIQLWLDVGILAMLVLIYLKL